MYKQCKYCSINNNPDTIEEEKDWKKELARLRYNAIGTQYHALFSELVKKYTAGDLELGDLDRLKSLWRRNKIANAEFMEQIKGE
jgi:hypothetical protein